MAQILARNLDEKVVRQLKKRATREGRPLPAEVKRIPEQASNSPAVSPLARHAHWVEDLA